MADVTHTGEVAGDEIALIVTTVPDQAVGEQIVRALVEERLIACGNLFPGVTSIYRWEGEVTKEGEVLVLLKSDRRAVERVFERVAELHPYAVPELVEVPVAGVSSAYRRWVMESTEVTA